MTASNEERAMADKTGAKAGEASEPKIWQRIAGRLRIGKAYRPARHYMRGPGPACHAKEGDSGSGAQG